MLPSFRTNYPSDSFLSPKLCVEFADELLLGVYSRETILDFIPKLSNTINAFPYHHELKFLYYALFLKIGERDCVISDLKHILLRNPDYGWAWLNLGIAIQNLSSIDAICCFCKAIVSPLRLKWKNKAITHLRELIAADVFLHITPDDLNDHFFEEGSLLWDHVLIGQKEPREIVVPL